MKTDKTKRIITSFGIAALFGLLLAAPFAWLEIRNNPATARDMSEFPLPLFGILWLLPTVFTLALAPLMRNLRTRENILARPFTLLLRVTLLALVAVSWVWLVNDQLPCFLGVPNCD
jgi:hypothetical protein